MKKKKRLLFARSIFLFIILVAFGIIIFTEKAGSIFLPKAKEKITNYINDKYKDEIDNFKLGKITFKNATYTMKITNKENKNHYFYVTYHNKKTKDTYKKDYIEGKTLLSYIKKKLKKEIENKTSTPCEIIVLDKLNDYTTIVQNRIIKEDNLKELKFYNLKKELIIKEWNSKYITESINKTINIYKDNNITPKKYIITITNKEDVTTSIEITLTEDFINNSNNEKIISDIIDDNNSVILKENKITYKYLN